MGRSVNGGNTPSAAKPSAQGAPGSNGFWRRRIFSKPGTFNWTATKSGKVKAQMIGTGAGASGTRCGPSGGYAEKTFDVVEGETITIVVGQGGAGNPSSSRAGNGTATSISGPPVSRIAGGGPLTIAGATGPLYGTDFGTPGAPLGTYWDKFFGGGGGADGVGGTSSASPFGGGFTAQGSGGSGWGGPSLSPNGAGTHGNVYSSPAYTGGPGLTAESADLDDPNGKSRPFWDLEDVDSSGGCTGVTSTGGSSVSAAGNGGVGSGAAYLSPNQTGVSPLGGGNGGPSSNPAKAGNGAGGASNSSSGAAGAGGDGWVALFWDEVA